MSTWGRHGGAPAPRPKKRGNRGGIKKHTQDWARSVEAEKGLAAAHADLWELLDGNLAAVDAPGWILEAAGAFDPQFEKALRGQINAVDHEDNFSDDDNFGGPDVNISDVEEYSVVSDYRGVSDAGGCSVSILSHSSDSEPPQKRSRTSEAVAPRTWNAGPERSPRRNTAGSTSTRERQEEWPLPSRNKPLRKMGRMRTKSSARWQTVRWGSSASGGVARAAGDGVVCAAVGTRPARAMARSRRGRNARGGPEHMP